MTGLFKFAREQSRLVKAAFPQTPTVERYGDQEPLIVTPRQARCNHLREQRRKSDAPPVLVGKHQLA